MFTIELLPAGYGDSIWIEYGDEKRPHRILIDCGILSTFKALKKRIFALDDKKPHFELFIITHIDADHIEGAVKLLNSDRMGVRFDDVWFNDWHHLTQPDKLGSLQGEFASALMKVKGIPHNRAFNGQSVVIPDDGELPTRTLPGGMKLTLLSPGWPQLTALRSVWKKEMKAKGILPGSIKDALICLRKQKQYADLLGTKVPNVPLLAVTPFEEDTAKPNGSSIVVLAEFEHKRCLFAADAHPSVVSASIKRLLAKTDSTQLNVEALKVCHHGSKYNNSPALFKQVRAKHFLVSTNGSKFYHPHPECIARIIRFSREPTVHFNYLSKYTSPWCSPALQTRYKYRALAAKPGKPGIAITL